jgi:hypothetical protein
MGRAAYAGLGGPDAAGGGALRTSTRVSASQSTARSRSVGSGRRSFPNLCPSACFASRDPRGVSSPAVLSKFLSVTLITLFQFFVDLCLLRRNPQDLPASTALFGVILVVALFAGLLLALTAGAGFGQAFAQSVLDLLLLLGVLHVALKATDKQARYVQTATALLGADALIGGHRPSYP